MSYGAQGGTLYPVYHFTAALSGANENPPTATSGRGTASHIHCCAVPPTNANVATTVPRFVGFPTGVTSGTYLHTLDMTDPGGYNPAFVSSHGGTVPSAETALLAGLLAGQAYLNVHTTMFQSGEIRGVLSQTPDSPG